MRIGIDATFIGTEKPTGLAVYTRNIVNELAKLHKDIIVWTCDAHGFDIPTDKVRFILKKMSFLGEKRFAIRPLWMELFLPYLIRKEKVDILYSTVPGGMRWCPVPHVVTVHDLTPLTFSEDHPRTVQWNFKYRLPGILKRSAAVVADSEHTKRDVTEKFGLNPASIRVIGLGYDTENFRPVNAPDVLERYGLRQGEYIIAVGSANRRKNLKSLIAALGKIREFVPHRLVLAGPLLPTQRQCLLDAACDSGVEDRLVFPGYVPYADLPALYSGAAVFAYISLYEGFGLPILEAMACGVPVLAANVTSIPEVAGDAAQLVEPLDVNACAAALAKIITDKTVSQRLRLAGFERTKAFSWGKTARQVLDTINACI